VTQVRDRAALSSAYPANRMSRATGGLRFPSALVREIPAAARASGENATRSENMSTDGTGRLSLAPHPILRELLYDPALSADRAHVLPYLLRIDGAHVLMLARQGILRRPVAAQLLAVQRDLCARLAAGEDLFASPGAHRGLYWLYEQEYIGRLGSETGGAAHVARSRNDINAAVARLRLRDELLALLDTCDALLQVAFSRAWEQRATMMSCFTHLQPAQPSSLGHYLTGVASELLRGEEWLTGSFPLLNRSPLGAAAGAGTSFPIDRELVASWLGFDAVIENSADAVATRDYIVHLLSALALLGTTLSRLGSDLQSWGSYAYGFVGWPDDLVSTSSIMPQKRNAFVWENMRGEATVAVGALVNTLVALKNTPFSNGVEVSGEATAHVWLACAAARKALALAALLLDRMEVRPERMRAFLDGAETTMTALADHLVSRHGLAFRTAHDAVGALVRGLDGDARPTTGVMAERLVTLVAAATGRSLELDEAEVAAALDPERCLLAARYGGGPAPEAVEEQLSTLCERRLNIHAQIASWRRRLAESAARFEAAIEELCQP
jgi:argininosuccinate lyase